MIQDVLVEPTAKLDISLLLKSSPSPPPRPTPSTVTSTPFSRATTITGETPAPQASNAALPSSTARSQHPVSTVPLQSYSQRQPASHAASVPTGQATAARRSTGGKRPLPKQAKSSGSPAKKSNRKWTTEEDEVLTELRGQGKKWEDISHHIPDRSDIACRLHFQNYVEKRPAWDEAKKDTLAMMYERRKKDMWQDIANELKIPWRTVEAMHWDLGRDEIARRAGTKPYYVQYTETETPLAPQRADNQVEGEGGFGAPRFPRPLQVATTEGVLLPSMAEFERGVPAFTETQVGGGRRAAQVRYEEEGDDEEEMADELERDMRRAAGQKRKD
ncbi:MAG: hypothetical protein LQ351_008070 [Letrouitia transgressa]|nr:MAG: hypothetical protein LQ351_008070 [Letrouitia transgressa]